MILDVKIRIPTLLLGGALFSAYYYKPSKEHFQNFFKEWARDQIKQDIGSSSNSVIKFFKGVTTDALAEIFSRVTDTKYQDLMFCAKVTVTMADDSVLTFFGVYNNWFLMEAR